MCKYHPIYRFAVVELVSEKTVLAARRRLSDTNPMEEKSAMAGGTSQIDVEISLLRNSGLSRTHALSHYFDLLHVEKEDRELMMNDFLRTNKKRYFYMIEPGAKVSERIASQSDKRGQETGEVTIGGAATRFGHQLMGGNSVLSSVWIG